MEASTHCRQEGGHADRLGAHVGHWQEAAFMPMQFTNVECIVSKVNVVVLAVPSFAHGQFSRPSLFMKP